MHLKQIFDEKIVTEVVLKDFYKVDMFMPDKNLIIEVQGHVHNNGLGQLRLKDRIRREVLKKLGYKYCEISSVEYKKLIQPHKKTEFLRNRISVNLM